MILYILFHILWLSIWVKEEIFENLPGTKISKLVREIAEGKTSQKDFVPQLQEQLGLSKEIAKELATEVEERVISQAKEVPIEEEISAPEKEIIPKRSKSSPVRKIEVEVPTPPEKTEEAPSPNTPEVSTSMEEKPTSQPKGDVYREPLE